VLFNNSFYNQILRLLSITVGELEALRLLDVEDLKEEVIGKNIKKSFWEDLNAARMKIALVPYHRKSYRDKRR
jgi:Predicted DNA-binding proteins